VEISGFTAMSSRKSINQVFGLVNSIPVLAPEVQLFDKAKDPRSEDERDFSAVLPHFTAAQIVCAIYLLLSSGAYLRYDY